MTNPFDDAEGRYLVVANDQGRYALWPAFLDVPGGWTVVHGEDGRRASLDIIAQRWTDASTIGVGPAAADASQPEGSG